jgi:TPR repeat protein
MENNDNEIAEKFYRDGLSQLDLSPFNIVGGYNLVKESANLGHPGAQNRLGMIFEGLYRGKTPEPFSFMKNIKLASDWYKLSADQKYPEGIYNYARLIYLGKIEKYNRTLAVTLWQEAAELGSNKAAYCLAKVYLRGELVEQDIEVAYMLAFYSKSIPESRTLYQAIENEFLSDALIETLRQSANKLIKNRNPEIFKKAEPDSWADKVAWDLIIEKIT